jgi:phenylalanine dehydrogenase
VRHGQLLKERGIVYAPDYIVNAGGLIQVADELYGPNKERVLEKTKTIYSTLLHIYAQAEAEQITTVEAANRFCEERLRQRSRRNNFFTHHKRPKWDIRR